MANYEETLTGLTEDQQRVITDKVKAAKTEAEDWAKTELQKEKDKLQQRGEIEIAKVKKDIRDRAKAVRKPDQYNSTKDIKAYIHSWEGYKIAMGLADDVAIASFLTYLDPVSRKKLSLYDESLGTMSWTSFTATLIKTLGTPQARMALKHKLRNLKQKPTESVNEFYNRMLELAAEAFSKRQQKDKELTLREVLCSGLRSETTAIEIMEHEDWTFNEALEYAIKRDTAINARKTIADGENEEVAIFTVDESRPGPSSDKDWKQIGPVKPRGDKNCYNCHKPGHVMSQCREKTRCFFCNRHNHVKRNCIFYQDWLQKTKNKSREVNPAPQANYQNSTPRQYPTSWKMPTTEAEDSKNL